MTYYKSLFSSYSEGYNSAVELGNSKTVNVIGYGTVNLKILVNGKRVTCQLQNVLHVPDLGYQVVSVTTLDKSGHSTSFSSRRCWIKKGSNLLATGTMTGNL